MIPMLIIFGPTIVVLIIYIISARRTAYKPEPIKYVSTRDRTNDKDWCGIHNMYFGHIDTICPLCNGEYHNDIDAGVYPPGVDDNNRQFYYVEDWIALRKIDLIWQDSKITEQEAINQKMAYIKKTIPKRIAVATGTDPDIQRAKIEANQRRSHNYAGAAQYSGITFKL